jgi:hypothetical protein
MDNIDVRFISYAKGYGIFSRIFFQEGDLIFKEQPLVSHQRAFQL